MDYREDLMGLIKMSESGIGRAKQANTERHPLNSDGREDGDGEDRVKER